jgi:uncharacterized protein
MRITFDPRKNAANIVNRQLPFTEVADFDWTSATIIEGDRKNYPEQRFVATGYLGGRLHVLCFTPIEDGIRVISFRKANHREARKHGKPLTLNWR